MSVVNEREIAGPGLPLAAALIPVRPGGQILLQLRDNRPDLPAANCWSTVGGAVEAGETPEQAVCRETEEEIGCRPTRLIHLGAIDGRRFRSHLFATRAAWALDDLILGEGQGVDWFDPERISALPLANGIGAAIVDFLGSPVYRALAAGGPPAGEALRMPPLPARLARELGLRGGQLIAVEGASAAFVRRLWDLLDGARVTASLAAYEQADTVLWWPRGPVDAAALAAWRGRLKPGGALWYVGGDFANVQLAAGGRVLGLEADGAVAFPMGERAIPFARSYKRQVPGPSSG